MDEKRRTLCKVAGLAVVGSVLPNTACLGGGTASGTLIKVTEKATDVPLGDFVEVRVPDHNINVCRDAGGLYAMSANCTHARCVLVFQSTDTGFLCTCHG